MSGWMEPGPVPLPAAVFYGVAPPHLAAPALLDAAEGTSGGISRVLAEQRRAFCCERLLGGALRPALAEGRKANELPLEVVEGSGVATWAQQVVAAAQAGGASGLAAAAVDWPPLHCQLDLRGRGVEAQLTDGAAPFALALSSFETAPPPGLPWGVRCDAPGGVRRHVLAPDAVGLQWDASHSSATLTLISIECMNWLEAARSAGLELYGAFCAALLPETVLTLKGENLSGYLPGCDWQLIVRAELWTADAAVRCVPLESSLSRLLGSWVNGGVLAPFVAFLNALATSPTPVSRDDTGGALHNLAQLLPALLPWMPVLRSAAAVAPSPLFPLPGRPFFAVIVIPEAVRTAFLNGSSSALEVPALVVCYPNPKGTMMFVYDDEAAMIICKGQHALRTFAAVYDTSQKMELIQALTRRAGTRTDWDVAAEAESRTVALLPGLHAIHSLRTCGAAAPPVLTADKLFPRETEEPQLFELSPHDVLVRQLFDVRQSPFVRHRDETGEISWRPASPPASFLEYALDTMVTISVEYIEKLAIYLYQATGKAMLRHQKQLSEGVRAPPLSRCRSPCTTV